MAGPHPPNPALGADGAQQAQPYPQTGPSGPETLEFPHHLSDAEQAFTPTGPPAPGPYRKRRPKRLLIGTLLAIALVAALTTAIVYGVRTNGANTGSPFSEGSAKTAIQSYLNSLAHRDIDGIVRNSLCGIYDSVKDKRSDQALARLSSDAFRKQFSDVAVTTIDKIVYLSQYQAQVLFQRGDVLVCSYVLRTTGQF